MKRNLVISFLILLYVGLNANAQKKTFTETVNGVSFKMIYVEGGTFTMGASPEQHKYLQKNWHSGENSVFYYNMFGRETFDDEYPAHKVSLDSYFIGETEVSQELWDAVMDVKSSHYLNDENEKFNGTLQLNIGKKYPMHSVSWYDAQEFCEKLSQITGRKYCLPTEAQWEYAARGGKYSKKYVFSGNDFNFGNWQSGFGTHYVKSSKPNELGLYNMNGNVGEWCYDWYGEYSATMQKIQQVRHMEKKKCIEE